MKRGPKPVPTEILKLRGSWRANDRPDLGDATVEAPSCPRWLPKLAKAEWARLVPLLKARGTIQRLDRSVLMTHCVAVSDYQWLTGQIEGQALDVDPRRRAYSLRDKAWAILYRTAVELGLSPTSRTRVPMKPREVEPKKKGGLAARLADGS